MGCTGSKAAGKKSNRPDKRGLDDTKHPKAEKFDDDDEDEDEDEDMPNNGKRGLDDTKHVKGSKNNTDKNASNKPKKSIE